jgi:hypothetical protein
VDLPLICDLGTLNTLTFPVIQMAHGLDNLTDISLAAMHRLANSFISPVLLEHLGNPSSQGLRVPHCVSVEYRITPSQG